MDATAKSAFPDLSPLLSPRSIVVVGASERDGNLGGATIERLKRFGFAGPVFAMNRTGTDVLGAPGVKGFADLPETPDMAIFSIPADGLLEAVRDAIAAGVRSGVAFAGGLAEAGAEGRARQDVLTDLCLSHGFLLCGPNCVGLINAAAPVTATFATALIELDELRPSVISMVSHSGGIGTTALTHLEWAGFGLRHMVSCGNDTVVTFADYLNAFALDEGTKVIVGYLEGIRDGDAFVRALAEARRRDKAVILIKAGATETSARAAMAHTGSLVGEDRVFDAVLSEFGVIRAYSVDEMIDIAVVLAGTPRARGLRSRGVGLVTFGGGNGVLGADQCARHRLDVPPLGHATVERLRPLLVSVASAANPMDLTPTTALRAESMAALPAALDVVAGEPDVGSLVFIVGSMAARGNEIMTVLEDFWRRCDKPVILSWPAPPRVVTKRSVEAGIFNFLDPKRGIAVLDAIASSNDTLERAVPEGKAPAIAWHAFVPDGEAPVVVTEDRCHAILREAGLSAADGRLATTADEAVAAAQAIGLPVALKAISPAVTHRAAAGLVDIGLGTLDDVRAAFLRQTETARNTGTRLDGLYVQRMAAKGPEILVSAMRDPLFGPVVTVGAGGGLTELLDDVAISRAPVDEATAARMLGRLKVSALLSRAPGAATQAARFVSQFSLLAAAVPFERFVFEINPVIAHADGAVAVDGLMIVEER